MTQVILGKSLSGDTKIWRYMSLDKFIDLISTEQLFFSPTASYIESDPFEGYLPVVGMDALKEISPGLAQNGLLKPFVYKLAKGMMASCWHINEGESEAMWRLYSDNKKGIAVQSTVGSLNSALQRDQIDETIWISKVKYIDFFDRNLKPSDCVIDGNLAMSLLKRKSYEHENELRAFITPKLNLENIHTFQPTPKRIDIHLSDLIKQVVISPLSNEPFVSSVKSICTQYRISESKVYHSELLSGHEKLLSLLGK
jgi:hypothetical protein